MKYEEYVHFLATSTTPMISHQAPVKQATSVPTSSTPWITSAATVIYPAANRSLSSSYDTISQGLGEQSNTALTVNSLSTYLVSVTKSHHTSSSPNVLESSRPHNKLPTASVLHAVQLKRQSRPTLKKILVLKTPLQRISTPLSIYNTELTSVPHQCLEALTYHSNALSTLSI